MHDQEDTESISETTEQEVLANKDCTVCLVETEDKCNQPAQIPLTAPEINNDHSFFGRESLGILSTSFLAKESFTNEQLKLNMAEFRLTSNSSISPRESLGILNLSDMDYGRESMQLFNLNTNDSSIRNEFTSATNAVDTNVKITITTSSQQNPDSSSSMYLNRGFFLSASKKFSDCSSILSRTSEFNFKSLNEPSPIFPLNFSQFETFNFDASKFKIDTFNDAFINSSIIFARQSSLSKTQQKKESDITKLRHGIRSLPANFDDTLPEYIQNDLEDSVFLRDEKQTEDDEDDFEKWKNFDENDLLDSIQEPDWPHDLDTSVIDLQAEEKLVFNKETVQKKIDLLLGKEHNEKKADKRENIEQENYNFPVINVDNQNNSNKSLPQNLSKMSQESNENALELIKNLSDILKSKENMSLSRKNEFLVSLSSLANELSNELQEVIMSEDSGHSSINDHQQFTNDNYCPETNRLNFKLTDKVNNNEQYQILDLSCINKDSSEKISKRLSVLRLPPAPRKVTSPVALKSSKCNRNLAFQSPTRDSAIPKLCNSSTSMGSKSNSFSNKETVVETRNPSVLPKFKKPNPGGATNQKGPLRAVIPLENMAKKSKLALTPPEKQSTNKLNLQSARTSTPIKEPVLKPVLTSTPSNLSLKNNRKTISDKSKNKLFPLERGSSFNLSSKNTNNAKSTVKNMPKMEYMKSRKIRSVSDVNLKRVVEPKITSALAKVRQNILNSPFYSGKLPAGGVKKEASSSFLADIKNAKVTKSNSEIFLGRNDKENVEP